MDSTTREDTMRVPQGASRLPAALVAATIGLGCGGGSSGPSGDQATIDQTSVATAVEIVSSVVPICQAGGAAGASALQQPEDASVAWLARLVDLRRTGELRATLSVQGLGSTQPPDEFGDCGGRMTYADYNHVSGVTSGTLVYENYCSINDETGDRVTANGRIPFVNTGTPSASGPITTRIEADSPDGVTFVTRSSTGTQLGAENVRFTDYLYRPGVPDGTPTASNPDRLTLEDARITNLETGKVYRQSDYSLTTFETASGGEQVTVSGRGYRSSGDWFQVSTATPLTSNASGDILGGAFTFTGDANSTATVTMVPGAILQGTVRINGAPMTGLPACR